jgi:hypothetical protein
MGVADRLPVFCWLVASFSMLVLFAGVITSIAGNTEIITYSGRFAAFDVVSCTVDEIKVIEFESGFVTQHVAVAGVSVRDKLGLFAAIRQAATPKRLIDRSQAEAVKTLNVEVGREYTCGFPTDAVVPTSFNAVRVGPADLENVIPVDFSVEDAEFQFNSKERTILAGWILLGLGGIPFVLFLLTLAYLKITSYTDDCVGCMPTCCFQSAEERELEARINSSRAKTVVDDADAEAAEARL